VSAKTKNILGVILLFIFGMIAGIAVTLTFEGLVIKRALANPDRGWDILSRRMSRELNLTDEQKDQIKVILENTRDELARIREQAAPQVDTVLDNSRTEIEKILTPEQQEKFDQVYSNIQAIRERYGHRHRFGRRGNDNDEARGRMRNHGEEI
jgi:Spy/CpxP family protein refolding chaperone